MRSSHASRTLLPAARRWSARGLAFVAALLLVPVVTVSPAAADPVPIAVSMTASPTTVAPGGRLTYTITGTNNEPQVANVRLTDQLTGLKDVVLTSSRGYCTEQSLLVTCSGGDMPGHGSTWVVTITGTVTAGSGTFLSNTVTFTANWSAQNTSHDYAVNATTNVPVGSPDPGPMADLSTALVGPSSASPGQSVDYTLTVYNQGFQKASDVLVSGTVPAGFDLQFGKSVTGTSLFACSVSLPSFRCLGGAVNAGANATINLPLVVSSTTPPAGGSLTYKLTAVVDPENAIAEPDDLQSSSNNASQIVTTVPAGPAPTEPITFVKKASSPVDTAAGTQVRPGDTLTYSITATNTSTRQTATRLIISDGTQGLDQSAVAAKASDPKLVCTNSNNLVTCQAPNSGYTLGTGASVTVTITGRVVQPPSSIITNTATLQTLQNKVSITRRASVTTIVRPAVDLTVTQYSTCADTALLQEGTPGGCLPFRARNQFDYLITVGNSGLDDAKGVLLRQPLPADVIYEGFTNLAGASFACDESGSSPVVVTCTGGTVPGATSSGVFAGTTRQLRLHLTAPNSTGPISSTVYADAYNAIPESDETNNTFTTRTPIATGVDLHISQKLSCPRQQEATDICDPVAPSGTVVYSLLVQNLGTQDATDIKVSDLLPTGTRFRSAKEINGAVFGLPYTPNHNVSCSSDGGTRVDCTGGRLQGIYAAYGGPKLDTSGTPDGFTIQVTAFAPAPYGPASSPDATGSPILNQALVDPDSTIPEFVETNNLNILETNVGIPATAGDQGTFHELTVRNEQVNPKADEAVAPNGTLEYQLTVSNWGSDPVSNVTVVDHLPAGSRFRDVTAAPLSNGTGGFGCSLSSGILTCTNGSLAASPSIGTPTSTTITILLFAPGTLSDKTTRYTNHAVVDPSNAVAEADETNNISDVGLTVKLPDDGGKNAYNDLSIVNAQSNPTADKAVTPNGTLEYTLTARNSGSDIAQNVTVYDYVPQGARFRNVTVDPYKGAGTSGGFVCSFTTGLLTCSNGTLAGGGSATIKVLLFAPDTPSSETQYYTNHAVIDPNGTIAEANENDNTADTNLTVNIEGENAFNELKVAQEQSFPTSDGAVAPGGTLRYVLKVTNTGSDTAFHVAVRDHLPQDAVFRKARLLGSSGGTTDKVTGFVCTHSAGTVDCTNGTLPKGGTAAIEILLFAPQQPSSPGSETTIVNQAVVDQGNAVPEADETNNTSTKETTVALGGAGAFWDLAVADNASPTKATPDSVIQWSFTVQNLGTDDLFNAVVRNSLPAGVRFIGAGEPGTDTTSPGRFTCTESDGVITCTGGTLKGTANGGAARTINVSVYAPHQNVFIANQAMADPDDAVVEADETNNAYRVITDVQSVIDLATEITTSGTFGPGDTGNVIGHIKNLGSATAYDVAFEMSLPVGVTPLDVQAPPNTSCEIYQNPISKIVCTAAVLEPGEVKVDATVYSNTSDAKNASALVNGDNRTVETDDGVHANNTFQKAL